MSGIAVQNIARPASGAEKDDEITARAKIMHDLCFGQGESAKTRLTKNDSQLTFSCTYCPPCEQNRDSRQKNYPCKILHDLQA